MSQGEARLPRRCFERVGWKARIGVITPFAGMAVAADFHRIAPEGVALALQTLPQPITQDTVAQLAEVGSQVAEAARRLVRPKADVVLWNTSSGSLICGPGYDQTLIAQMEAASGLPCTTASTAMIQAFHRVRARRICLATPYTDDINALEKAFIEAHGFEVVAMRGLRLVEAGDIVDVTSATMYRLVHEVDCLEADCVFISNAGLSVLDVIPVLEEELGKTVLSTNQVSLWGAFRLAGIDLSLPGVGRLLQEP